VTRTATASSSSSGAELPAQAARTAVVDLGSNSFRLVVFTATPRWWRRTDEIYEPVRISEGMGDAGMLQPAPLGRALQAVDVFAHFTRASGLPAADVHAVGTSAIREARNADEFLVRAQALSGLSIDVLSREREAFYGYVAAVNSTTLSDGVVLDLGGGSMQLVRVEDRGPRSTGSWPLGAVRMTERFLGSEKASKKALKTLREHVARALVDADLGGAHLVGLGGTVRNLAVAAQKAAEMPEFGVQGYRLTDAGLQELVERLAALPAARRGEVPGIKPERADLILAGALVVQAVLRAGGYGAVQATEAGLREGIFLAGHVRGDPPLIDDVREASVHNLAAQYDHDDVHSAHVARLALGMFDALAARRVHPGDPAERELLWAAAVLHDIGTAVDYDDHHKHSRYLILNAGLPGFDPRETALVALMARYHRKGTPRGGFLRPWLRKGDEAMLTRCAALPRVAEQLERSRDQIVREARVAQADGEVRLELVADGDVSVARWAAERQGDVFERAFGRPLTIAPG